MNTTIIEEWRPVTLVEFSSFYEVSNLGRVRGIARFRLNKSGAISPVRPRLMGIRKSPKGYCYVYLRAGKGVAKNAQVHRLVALAFTPNPLGLNEVNHIDLDKSNNRVENLEWASRIGNYLHAAAAGRAFFKRTLSDADIRAIREFHTGGMSQRAIALRYGINPATVSRIVWEKRRKTA